MRRGEAFDERQPLQDNALDHTRFAHDAFVHRGAVIRKQPAVRPAGVPDLNRWTDMRRIKRSRYSHKASLTVLCLFTAAPTVIAAVVLGAGLTPIPNTISAIVLILGATFYVWSHFLTAVFFTGDILVVQTPLSRREFVVEDMAGLFSHGGARLISRKRWPYFVFSPENFELTPAEKTYFTDVINRKLRALEQPNNRVAGGD